MADDGVIRWRLGWSIALGVPLISLVTPRFGSASAIAWFGTVVAIGLVGILILPARRVLRCGIALVYVPLATALLVALSLVLNCAILGPHGCP